MKINSLHVYSMGYTILAKREKKFQFQDHYRFIFSSLYSHFVNIHGTCICMY